MDTGEIVTKIEGDQNRLQHTGIKRLTVLALQPRCRAFILNLYLWIEVLGDRRQAAVKVPNLNSDAKREDGFPVVWSLIV